MFSFLNGYMMHSATTCHKMTVCRIVHEYSFTICRYFVKYFRKWEILNRCSAKKSNPSLDALCPTFSNSCKCIILLLICAMDTLKEEMILLLAQAINQRRQVAWQDRLEALDSSVYIQRSYRQWADWLDTRVISGSLTLDAFSQLN